MDLAFKIMMNVSNPDRAFGFAQIPNEGWVYAVRIHHQPYDLCIQKHYLKHEHLPREIVQAIQERMAGYTCFLIDFYVDKLVEGISTLAVAFKR